MKNLSLIAFIGLSIAASGQAPQPWSEYTVHDVTRPHPAKIAVADYVSIPAPADAIVIFDGKSTDALTKKWPVKDGILIASKLGDNKTKESFGDCQVHLEWRIPKGRKVEGQKGGNSGIFIMDKYEIQIQESHTNVTYADGQATAIYGQTPPIINASRPQGEWQSYDIFFKAPVYKDGKVVTPAYVTILHNGIIVQNNQPIHGPTRHKVAASYPKNHPVKAPIRLQWHSDPIEFKSFWVRDLSTKVVTKSAKESK